jgi:GntR family transcriptional regulator
VIDAIQRDSRLPYYDQLKRLIEHQIENNHLRPGDLLPSEAELGERYGVSRTVVRQAIGEMVNEGQLYRMQGKGTFVAQPKLREQFLHGTGGLFQDFTSKGHVVTSNLLKCEVVEAPDRALAALELTRGAQCIEIDRVRYVDGDVVVFTKSFLSRDIHPSLKELLKTADLERGSLYAFLEQRCGISIASGRRSLQVIKASEELAALLEIDVEEPVLFIDSTGRDAAGRPVEYFEAWHRADRTKIEIDVVRDPSSRA